MTDDNCTLYFFYSAVIARRFWTQSEHEFGSLQKPAREQHRSNDIIFVRPVRPARVVRNVDPRPLKDIETGVAEDIFRIFERYSFRNIALKEFADVVDAPSKRLVTSHARIEVMDIKPKLISALI